MDTTDKEIEREKILARIQKCMRLSKSANANEAATALRQAQKLMENFSVTEAELLGLEITNVLVVTIWGYTRKVALPLNILINLIRKAFQVEAVTECVPYKNGYRYGVRYFGSKGKPEMAQYAHEVITRQLVASWKSSEVANRLANIKGGRTGFWIGWLHEVSEKVIAFANPEEKEMAKKAIAARYGELGKGKVNNMSVCSASAAEGAKAAGDFSIHRPMGGSSNKQRAIGN